jgi:hypothetical protein
MSANKPFNVKAKCKAYDKVKLILEIRDQLGVGGEDDLLMVMRELRKVEIEAKDDKSLVALIQCFTTYIQDLLNNTYIAAEELLKEAKENKGYHYQRSNLLYLLDGKSTTLRGTSGKEYPALSSTVWSGCKALMVCNEYGFTDEFNGPYKDCTSVKVALGTANRHSFKGEKIVHDGIDFGVIKLFPHKIASRGGKKTPQQVIADHAVEATPTATVELPPQNILGAPKPLDQVSSSPTKQQLQPQT